LLEKLEHLAANATALADNPHNDATEIAEIYAKALNDASRLAALKGNKTLIKECEIILVAERLEHEFKELIKLEKFIAIADNSSAVASKTEKNSTKIAKIAAEASKYAIKLQKHKSNTTLVGLCLIIDAFEREKHQCEKIKKLEKFIAFADNSTAVADKTENNATKIDEIKAQAFQDAALLAKLKSNVTLVSDCAALEKSAAESLAGKSLLSE
jgi:hypothetical protein